MNGRYGQNATDFNANLNVFASSVSALENGLVVATVRLAPAGETWNVNRVYVKGSSAVLEAKATTYRGQIADAFAIESSISGSTGDSTDTPLFLNDGEAFWVQWVGGDLGATFTATLSGWRSTPQGGFRSMGV